MPQPRTTSRLTRFLPLVAGLCMVAAVVVVTSAIEAAWQTQHAQEERLSAMESINRARKDFELLTFSRFLLTTNLVSFLSNNPNPTDKDVNLLARDLVRLEQGFLGVRLAKNGVVGQVYPLQGRALLLGQSMADMLPPDCAAKISDVVRENGRLLCGPAPGINNRDIYLYVVPVYQNVVGLTGTGPFWGMAVFEMDLKLVLADAGIGRKGAHPVSVRPLGAAPAAALAGEPEVFTRPDAVTAELSLPWGSFEFATALRHQAPVRDVTLLLGLAVALVLGAATWTAAQQVLVRLRTQARYQELVQNARSMILRVTPAGAVSFINEYAQEFFGFPEEQILGRSLLQTIVPPHGENGRDLRQETLDLLARPEEFPFVEQQNAKADGTRAWVSWAVQPLYAADGSVQEIMVVGMDITARKAMEARLIELATADSLTGVANRRHFLEKAEAEMQRSARYGHPLSLVLIDLDHFKKVNDTRGHHVGDEALQHLCRVLGHILRDVDLLGRMGGEEFAVLLPETDLARASRVAERMRSALESAPVVGAGDPLTITMSAGVAAYGPGVADIDTLLQKADAAMYQAKAAGRNRVMAAA
jgi:diguanylate cyclase (GGDEF)-like protein/PAS domain S-box-containing protein